MRALQPEDDDVDLLPASRIGKIFSDPPGSSPAWIAGAFLDRADTALTDGMLDLFGSGGTAPFESVQLRHLGGAAGRDVAGGSAAPGRNAQFALGVVGMRPSSFLTELPAAAFEMRRQLAQWLLPGILPNFAGASDSGGIDGPAWNPPTTARLAAIRRAHDPLGILARPVGR